MDGRDHHRPRLARHGPRRGALLPVGAGGRARGGDRGAVGQRRARTPATCTREQIDERTRQRAAAGDPTPGYDGYCRDLGLARGEGRALRFRTPDEGVVEVHDLVRGDVEFPQRALEDFICVKGNGQPLFVLANAVDDRTMAISHVIRGEDQLPTTPRQIMLWGALNRAEGVGSGVAGVRASATAGERAGEEALQAARPRGGGDVPRAGLPTGGLPQLPGAVGVEPR